jgi:uncharacterized SAM-binding protein YcdF (DUF218 family)
MDTDSLQAIGRFLFVKDEPTPVDLAMVLGSPSVNSIYPAISLFQAGLTRQILISGAGQSLSGQPEWEFYRDTALQAGIPNEALILEKQATNTVENFRFSAALIAATVGWSQVSSIALCAKPFHMRRTLMTARAFFPSEVSLIARPAEDPMNLLASNWADTPEGRRRVLEELGKISRYALQGDFDVTDTTDSA